MLQNRIVSLLFILVLILGHHQSHATTPFGRIRKLSRFLAAVNTQEIPPAPRPDSDSGNGKDSTGSDKCLLSSSSCSVKKLTACLRYSGNGWTADCWTADFRHILLLGRDATYWFPP